MIVIQGTAFPAAAAGVALRPVCHLSEFHTSYFFPPLPLPPLPSHAAAVVIFIHLSIIFLNSSLSVGNCSRTFVSLYVISPLLPPPCPPLLPSLLPPLPLCLLQPFSRRRFSASAEKRGPSHEPFNHGWWGKGREREKKEEKKAGEAPPKLAFPSQSSRGVFRIAE